MEPTNPLDRKLADMQHEIGVLQDRVASLMAAQNANARRRVLNSADEAKGRRLLADLLTLLARRLRDEA